MSEKQNSEKKTEKTETKPELKKCRFCGQMIASDAESCVHCGTKSPFEKEKLKEEKEDYTEQIRLAKFLWCVIGILFLICILGVCLFPACRYAR